MVKTRQGRKSQLMDTLITRTWRDMSKRHDRDPAEIRRKGRIGKKTRTAPSGRARGRGERPSDAAAALGRSALYELLARAIGFPEPALHKEALSGSLHRDIAESLRVLPYRLAAGRSRLWRPVRDYGAFQSEYIRVFEVGSQGQGHALLYGGHYGRERLRTMEELVRFYNYFGLAMTQGLTPDHVTVELEFMHHLTRMEAEARRADRESYLLAQRDFLNRHLGGWWPHALAAAERQGPQRFYRSLSIFVHRFLEAESRHIARALRGS